MGTLTALLREAETGHRRSGSKVAPVWAQKNIGAEFADHEVEQLPLTAF